MIELRGISLRPEAPVSALKEKAAGLLHVRPSEIVSLEILRRSVDARKKPEVRLVYTVLVRLKGGEQAALSRCRSASAWQPQEWVPPVCPAPPADRPVVVGFGPAGMFAALVLAMAGLRPIVLERGQDVDTRTAKVRSFWDGGPLDPECNVQFGEGGAGTFSDGKLNTGVNDVRIRWILQQFVRFGASRDILIDAKPHVGTDVLAGVVRSLRLELVRLGGEVRFGTRLDRLTLEDGRLTGLTCTCESRQETLACSRLVLAVGHSARDTFVMLHDLGLAMEPKPFSMGVRIEHRQSAIDRSQYGRDRGTVLPPADYKLNCRLPDGTSAYTFCMCPGGQVVAAASEAGGVVTNGMSCSARDGENANAALLVTLTPEDFPFAGPLGGMYWQRQIEQAAFAAGGGAYRAPAQRVGSFLGRGDPALSEDAPEPTYQPGVVFCDLHTVLPPRLTVTLEQALPALAGRLSAFGADDAVLTAPETRSSSPVRLLRGPDLQATLLSGLYPCGEGAGYAGGITSAAVDGLRCAEALIASLL